MLKSLYVKNLALIEEITMEFHDGLNILTGETGAGKSILIGSVMLALGGRYTADMLRAGSEYGYVELTFELEDDRLEELLKAEDIYPEEHQLVLGRRLMEGRSVSRINGEKVSMNQLKRAAGLLIDIYGQRDAQSLLQSKGHRGLLDSYAGESLLPLKRQMADAFNQYRKARKVLDDLDMDEESRAREADLLAYEIQEITQAELKPDEDVELEKHYERMLHSKKIMEGVQEAYDCTSEFSGTSAGETIGRALRSLTSVAKYDEQVEKLYEQLLEVDGLLNDFTHELVDYQKDLEFSEQEFMETENRLNEVNRLKAKYGTTMEKIQEELEERQSRLNLLEDYEEQKTTARVKYEEIQELLFEVAGEITKKRTKMADRMEKEVSGHLKDLNFADTRFEVRITEADRPTPEGCDQVEFFIAVNPGEPLKRLADVASGGELSRIMLAIKTAMSEKEATQTLIFDEIDSGISGRTAQKVSEKMAWIARNHQVLCITHLPQIASMADAHYLIEKKVHREKDVQKTVTDIQQLNQDESIKELARMLGGAEITDAVLVNAREMKSLAQKRKKEV